MAVILTETYFTINRVQSVKNAIATLFCLTLDKCGDKKVLDKIVGYVVFNC